MFKSIRFLSALVLLGSLLANSGVAQAHVLKNDSGFSAVMHMYPDDNPSANEPTVINFLIGRNDASYNQSDYTINLDVSANGKRLQRLVVGPRGFGNASDSKVTYIYPAINVYTLDLIGVNKTDSSLKFHMTFQVRVADSAVGPAKPKNDKGSQVLILSAGALAILVVAGFMAVRQGPRYKKKKS